MKVLHLSTKKPGSSGSKGLFLNYYIMLLEKNRYRDGLSIHIFVWVIKTFFPVLVPTCFSSLLATPPTDEILQECGPFICGVFLFLISHPHKCRGLLPSTSWIVPEPSPRPGTSTFSPGPLHQGPALPIVLPLYQKSKPDNNTLLLKNLDGLF